MSDNNFEILKRKFIQPPLTDNDDMNECEFVFAYGSNLNQWDWKSWCDKNDHDADSLEFVSVAILPDMKLCFDYHSSGRRGGVLDVQSALGHIVYGVIFKPTQAGWQALDRKEGAPYCYKKQLWKAILPNGTLQSVVIYEVTDVRRSPTFVKPTDEYVTVVSQGLTYWNLPIRDLQYAAANKRFEPEINCLFIYGTLMREQSRFSYIQKQDVIRIEVATVKGILHETTGNYPAMRLSNQNENSLVQGELVQFGDIVKAFPDLDLVEGFRGYDNSDSFYQRTLVEVQLENGNIVLAWTYVAFEGNWVKEPIISGSWKQHVKESMSTIAKELYSLL